MGEIRVRPEDRPSISPCVGYAFAGFAGIVAFAWLLIGSLRGTEAVVAVILGAGLAQLLVLFLVLEAYLRSWSDAATIVER